MSAARNKKMNAVRLASRAAVRGRKWGCEIIPFKAPPARAVTRVHHVFDGALDHMHPGDVLLLNEVESLRNVVDPAFFAILACPLCGKQDLITQSQYSGTDPVICGYDDCSCHFRIDQESNLIYLPVN
ncbi:MAG: hypothetical protein ACRD2B_18760 [Terriglobia bacterium]